MESEGTTNDPEVTKLVEQTIRFLVFVIRWLARRYGLEGILKT